MRQLVVALRSDGFSTPEAIYEQCDALRAAGTVPVLAVIPPEALRERVETTCESAGIG